MVQILLIEDNTLHQEVMTRVLESEGYRVEAIASGDLAVKLFEENKFPYEMVLMDISLPGIDGIQTTLILRSMGYVFPIIAISAHSEKRFEAMGAGCNAFASKPFRCKELKDIIKKYF